jgi:DNA invertase Pin-like site-specific DNA recombinase
METFEKHRVAVVSVTQQFNTSASMGRLVLNVLLSFAQFEREIIAERTRDKITGPEKGQAVRPLMQSQQTIGLDLPLRVLVWEDGRARSG